MLKEADKFNKEIHFNGKLYDCSFHGKTIGEEREYFVDTYLNGKSAGKYDMKYNPETGNFYISNSATGIAEEFELLLSEGIQNHDL